VIFHPIGQKKSKILSNISLKIMGIITLTQFKGGVGKTTSAICLSTLLSQQGNTLLIDSDLNRSASIWARKGHLPFKVCDDREAPKLLSQGKYEYIVIDTPARPASEEVESLAKGCDLMILPTTPDPLSLAALAQIQKVLPAETNYRCLLTMVPPKPQKDGEEALAALEQNGFPVFKRTIRRYKAYIKATDLGMSLNKVSGGGIAWLDWKGLWEELKQYV
jgi:chromosome partitioning protein